MQGDRHSGAFVPGEVGGQREGPSPAQRALGGDVAETTRTAKLASSGGQTSQGQPTVTQRPGGDKDWWTWGRVRVQNCWTEDASREVAGAMPRGEDAPVSVKMSLSSQGFPASNHQQ